jgi:hypothetical protein
VNRSGCCLALSAFRGLRLSGSVAVLGIVTSLHAQQANSKPLPDINALMHQVEANQRKAETIQKDYTYLEDSRLEELGGDGSVKKTVTEERDIFWLDGVPVGRLLQKNGKPLTPEEAKKENDRIDKEVAKAKEKRDNADAAGKASSPRGDDEVTFSRLLELGQFTNPRRVLIDGRPTIAVDYIGDPKAKTRNRAEAVIHDLAGTVWVDEDDVFIQHVEGRFLNSFKIAGGLLANVSQGTTFGLTNVRINGEAWLPQRAEAHGHARFLLFFNINGNGSLTFHDYRKFKTSSTIIPGPIVDPAAPAMPDAPASDTPPK